VTKSSEAEQARRVNLTLSLLQQRTATAEVLERLVARFGLSRRQAYRYVQQAQRAVAPLPVPEPKAVFTVKLPRSLILKVRRQAGQKRCSISLWVEQALRLRLDQANDHG
jgi:predicted DNA-binding transcriptional regulator YafY